MGHISLAPVNREASVDLGGQHGRDFVEKVFMVHAFPLFTVLPYVGHRPGSFLIKITSVSADFNVFLIGL